MEFIICLILILDAITETLGGNTDAALAGFFGATGWLIAGIKGAH